MQLKLKGVSDKSPAIMPAAAINRELDALDVLASAQCDEMIDAGRGRELFADWYRKPDDLSQRKTAAYDRRMALKAEVERRAGPNTYRLPGGRGFGPLKHDLGGES